MSVNIRSAASIVAGKCTCGTFGPFFPPPLTPASSRFPLPAARDTPASAPAPAASKTPPRPPPAATPHIEDTSAPSAPAPLAASRLPPRPPHPRPPHPRPHRILRIQLLPPLLRPLRLLRLRQRLQACKWPKIARNTSGCASRKFDMSANPPPIARAAAHTTC